MTNPTMNHFPSRNIHPEFDNLVTAKLGRYVYLLRDPNDHAPFYVGKGGGKESDGNERVLDHFKEASRTAPHTDGRSRKIARIHEIWERGQDVERLIIRHGLATEAAAFDVECSLMDTLLASGFDLTNETGGHGKHDRGVLTSSEVYAHAAPDFSPSQLPDALIDVPIFLFPIHNQAIRLLHEGVSDNHRFRQATSGYWSINAEHRIKPSIALGIMYSVSRGVYLAEEWLPVEKIVPSGKTRTAWRFEPKEPDQAMMGALLHKNFRTIFDKASFRFWQRGNPVAFRVDEAREIHILVGKRKDEIDR